MASLLLLDPPTSIDLTHASAIVKQAPSFLRAQRGGIQLPWPASLILGNESQEKWASYENILIASLQTGDYAITKECVEALTERFGKNNERVIIFQGMYDEATAADDSQLNTILKRYNDVLLEFPTMFSVQKRKVALLRSMGKTTDAITALTELLDASPTDAEAWVELADLYLEQGSLDQAIFSLEEVVMVVPNAWNIQAKLAEVLYLNSTRLTGPEAISALSESIRRFCRSVELSGDYLRAVYGLKQATTRYLSLESSAPARDSGALTTQKVERLSELATSKLAEILRKSKSQRDWNGYSSVELQAAQDLLDQHTASLTK